MTIFINSYCIPGLKNATELVASGNSFSPTWTFCNGKISQLFGFEEILEPKRQFITSLLQDIDPTIET